MAKKKYKTVCMQEHEYNKLKQIKTLYEQEVGRKTDWAGFLVSLGLGYLIGCGLAKRQSEDSLPDVRREGPPAAHEVTST